MAWADVVVEDSVSGDGWPIIDSVGAVTFAVVAGLSDEVDGVVMAAVVCNMRVGACFAR